MEKKQNDSRRANSQSNLAKREVEAASAYNTAAVKHFGEFAYTNDLLDRSDVALCGVYINGPLKNQKVKKEKL